MANRINKENLEPVRTLFGREFESFFAALSAAEQAWLKVTRSLEADGSDATARITKSLVESSNPLLSYLKPIEKKVKRRFFLPNWLGCNKTITSFFFDGIDGALQKCDSIFSAVYDLQDANHRKEEELQNRIRELQEKVESPSQSMHQNLDGNEQDLGKAVPFEQYEDLVRSYSKILGDAYSFLSDPNGKMVRRSAIINLENQGYEVVDYDGTNDEEFRVELESSISEPHVVSPSIRRGSDRKIVEKGLVYKPRILKK